MNTTQLSRFLSYVLRHDPASIGLTMDAHGWVSVPELLEKNGKGLTLDLLKSIVAEDAKQRYSFSSDEQQIRANQGHSVKIDLALKASVPPVTLFHGTHEGVVSAILKQGLKKMNRHHVHLSPNIATAKSVGARRGKPVVLTINTKEMVRQNIKFFLSDNGVWLTDYVAPEHIESQ